MNIAYQVNSQRNKLYRQYRQGKYSKWNTNRIDYVLDNVYKKQLKIYNSNEEIVKSRLNEMGIEPETLKIIPIASKGGKLEHLYIADMVVGNTIIEVDGPQHRKRYDNKRDKLTAAQGYTTIRIPTSDLSDETIDSYLEEVWTPNN